MMSKTDSTLFIYSIGHIRVKVCMGAYGFSLKELFHPPHLYSSGFLSLPDHLRRLPSPTHSGRRSLGHAVFAALQVLFSLRTTDRASLAISLALIGPLTPIPTGDSDRKSTRLNCSHVAISYAVFCLKKKKK